MDKNLVKKNKLLVEKYPFLRPYPLWEDEVDDYDYSWTYLDDMPKGWKIAFGEELCEELKETLGEHLKDYRITQVKEKYGSLRWSANYNTKRTAEILKKYHDLSERTCCNCGAPATQISLGWICPWCDNCAKKKIFDSFMPIDDFYS